MLTYGINNAWTQTLKKISNLGCCWRLFCVMRIDFHPYPRWTCYSFLKSCNVEYSHCKSQFMGKSIWASAVDKAEKKRLTTRSRRTFETARNFRAITPNLAASSLHEVWWWIDWVWRAVAFKNPTPLLVNRPQSFWYRRRVSRSGRLW